MFKVISILFPSLKTRIYEYTNIVNFKLNDWTQDVSNFHK